MTATGFNEVENGIRRHIPIRRKRILEIFSVNWFLTFLRLPVFVGSVKKRIEDNRRLVTISLLKLKKKRNGVSPELSVLVCTGNCPKQTNVWFNFQFFLQLLRQVTFNLFHLYIE